MALAALFCAPAQAQDKVVPSSRVVAAVVVREKPTTSSEALARLRPGEALELEDEASGWYRVRLPDGRIGYVTKSWTIVVREAAAAASPRWKVHFVDVGTGLAAFVEGPDFSLIYDGGSNDDYALGKRNRLLAYLRKVRPDLRAIDHLIISHPHRDHVELLPDLFDAYEIRNVWESGRVHDICGYRALLTKIANEPGVVYHDAHPSGGPHVATLPPKACYGAAAESFDVEIPHGDALRQGLNVALGADAGMSFLTADAALHPDPNENSVVVRLDLGPQRLLFMGDAEASSDREAPSVPPRPDFAEGFLVDCCAAALRSQMLVVGHHGSMSSSRVRFLDAVGAQIFIISSGPKRYGSVILPDQQVLNELQARGPVWRTDFDDNACRTDTAKIGPDADGKAGGCDNILVRIPPTGDLVVNYERVND